MSDIKWANVVVKISELSLWDNNPRQSSEKQAERITDSHRLFGQVENIAIGPRGTNGKHPVYNGHQRIKAWELEYGNDFTIEARMSSRPLDEAERQMLTVLLHAGATGGWNWDALGNWDYAILTDAGFDEDLLKEWNRDSFALAELLGAQSENGNNSDSENADGDAQPPRILTCPECGHEFAV